MRFPMFVVMVVAVLMVTGCKGSSRTHVRVVEERQVVVTERPVVYAPAPAPVYYTPAPVVVRHVYAPRPVYCAPRPVYVRPVYVAPVYRPGLRVNVRWGGHSGHHR